jgi:hypothetical protein
MACALISPLDLVSLGLGAGAWLDNGLRTDQPLGPRFTRSWGWCLAGASVHARIRPHDRLCARLGASRAYHRSHPLRYTTGWGEALRDSSCRGPTGQACRQGWPGMARGGVAQGPGQASYPGASRLRHRATSQGPKSAPAPTDPDCTLDPSCRAELPPASRWGFTVCRPAMRLFPPHHSHPLAYSKRCD